MSRSANRVGGALLATAVAGLLGAGCSLGQGTGCFANSSLDSPTCWSGPFDLQPNFFAANPTNTTALEIRIQNGIDNETFSDGLIILVDDVGQVRGDPDAEGNARPSLLGQPLAVALSPATAAPGIPIMPVANPAVIHAALYLNRTCRPQNVALYAMDAVTLEADGTCNRPEGGMEPPIVCGTTPASATPTPTTPVASDAATLSPIDGGDDGGGDSGAVEAGLPGTSQGPAVWCNTCPCPGNTATTSPGAPVPTIGSSTIRFNSLFDGDPAESNAAQRLTDADFDFFLGDPREACPGGLGPPPRCRGHLQGHFQFYFQRGRPAQPFP